MKEHKINNPIIHANEDLKACSLCHSALNIGSLKIFDFRGVKQHKIDKPIIHANQDLKACNLRL
ncbi:hypothetical protein [Flavobacterium sp. FlaQc-47]|uniref:hypothetical protein n=1 Tax=Flavobacterium sp. FlaQc-47 TaxID=3374180 RepID=UPI0037577FD7